MNLRENLKFYKCEKCGSLVTSGCEAVCCGEPTKRLIPNTSDGAGEKHVPVAVRENGKIKVDVGAVLHPMLPEHHIEWIAVVTEDTFQRIELKVGAAPTALFHDYTGPADVYEYCNLHGLWKSEI